MSPLWLPALVKAASTASVVVLASVLAEAVGPFWGALIASLPISAGPAYLFLSMQHDAGFVAGSALASFATNAATAVYLLAYATAARRGWGGWRCIGAALLAWLAAALTVRAVPWTAASATALNLVVYAIGHWLAARLMPAGLAIPKAAHRRWFELPLRAAIVAGFVTGLVITSALLGPRVTGIVAVFPISFSSILAIVRPRIGGPASCVLALTALRAMLGFGFALLTLHLTIGTWGAPLSLAAALLVSMLWPLGLTLWRLRGHA